MTTRVELPPGCAGLDLPDGSTLRPQELGGAVDVPDQYATAGLVHALGLAAPGVGFAHAPMGPDSATCGTCGFNRFVWSDRPDICPRCGRIEGLVVTPVVIACEGRLCVCGHEAALKAGRCFAKEATS